MQYCLAIDVAESKSMFCVLSQVGELVLPPTEYGHSISGFQAVLDVLLALDETDIHIIMESTSIYHLPVERFFREYTGYEIIILNPIISKENKRNLRKTKTDREDCLNLANIFFHNDYNQQNSHEQLYHELQAISRHLNHVQEGQNRTKNRFKQLLSLTCPEYIRIFKDNSIYSPTALHFIGCYPHCDMVKQKRVDALASCLGSVHKRHPNYYRRKAELIKLTLQDSFPAVTEDSETVRCLTDITKQLAEQEAYIDQLKARLIDLAQATEAFTIYISVPGIGPLTAALLIAEMKDISRFSNVKKLTAACGLDPTIIQSGKSINYHGPISKRGNRLSRKILFNAIMSILMVTKRTYPDNPIRLYYEKKRGEGKHHHACVAACSTKLLRILFAMCNQNSLFQ